MRTFLPWLLAAIPLLPLLAGLAARGRSPGLAARLTLGAAGLAAACAALTPWLLATVDPFATREALSDPGAIVAHAIHLRLDAVSAVMGILVSFLGWVVLRFSRTYLLGDAAQSRFFSWMSLTLAAVLLLVLSGHLLVLLGAWIATSLCLHRLLLYYPERAGAVFAARKKFVFSRLGDGCLLVAAVLIYQAYGTWDLESLFRQAATGNTANLPVIGYFLVVCAALKSAQFPFHSWLPDTMETPTPVSAFMHAGIINAGGFLMVRLSPLLVHAPGALTLLTLLGTFTAAFGAIVMLAQPSVKRALAFSTIAQMGFMMMQCGLGAFSLALLHIVAHSLYKAHAFLTAGSTIGASSRAAIPLRTPALTLGVLGGGLLVAGGATASQAWLASQPLPLDVFGVVLALALAYGLARIGSAGGGLRPILRGIATAAGICLISLALHRSANAVFHSLPVGSPPPGLLGLVSLVFVALFFFQATLWRTGQSPLGRRFYLHALNGFYVGTSANRLLRGLWPQNSNA